MNKEDLLQKMEESRERFLEVIEGLDEAAFNVQGVVGDWSLKDILMHLTRWEAELVKLLWQVRQGQRPTTAHFSKESVDEINARWYNESRDRELESVLEDFHGVRAQTMHRVEAFLDKELIDSQRYKFLQGQALCDYIAGDSYEHEDEHLPEIKAWREKQYGNNT